MNGDVELLAAILQLQAKYPLHRVLSRQIVDARPDRSHRMRQENVIDRTINDLATVKTEMMLYVFRCNTN